MYFVVFGLMILAVVCMIATIRLNGLRSYRALQALFVEYKARVSGNLTDTGEIGGLRLDFCHRGHTATLRTVEIERRKYTSVYALLLSIRDGEAQHKKLIRLNSRISVENVEEALDSLIEQVNPTTHQK